MGLIRFLLARAQIPAKRAFLVSVGFHETETGDWAADFSWDRLRKKDFRRWTLRELKKNYTGFMF